MQGPGRYIYPVIMAGIMSFVMSGLVTAINMGVGPDFVSRWMGAWSISGPIALVAVSIAAPVARRITGWIVTRLPSRPVREREA